MGAGVWALAVPVDVRRGACNDDKGDRAEGAAQIGASGRLTDRYRGPQRRQPSRQRALPACFRDPGYLCKAEVAEHPPGVVKVQVGLGEAKGLPGLAAGPEERKVAVSPGEQAGLTR